MSLLREAATAGLSAGLLRTAISVESSAYAYSLPPPAQNISLVYRMNKGGPNILPCGMLETFGIHSLLVASNLYETK